MRKVNFGLLLSAAGLVAAIACTSQEAPPASGANAGSGSASTAAAKPGRGLELYNPNCVACPGETGKILFRKPERAVILQP